MKKILLVSTYLCLFSSAVSAQSFVLLGDKTFGTSGLDVLPFITYLGADKFILVGFSTGDLDGDKTDPICDTVTGTNRSDLWMLKIDTAFNILWDYSIGGVLRENYPAQIQNLNDGKFIMASHSQSDISCEKSENNRSYPNTNTNDYWICMFDSSGTLLWDKTYGGTGTDQYVKMVQLSGGEFVVCGISGSGISGDKTVPGFGGSDYWVLKLDSMGNKIWDNVYGGSGLEHQDFHLLADSSNNFLIVGATMSDVSGTITDTSQGILDIWLVKIDSDGVVLFDKRNGGSNVETPNHAIQTPDGYLICGSTNSPQGLDVSEPPLGVGVGGVDVWIVKLDTSGNKIWDKRYGGNGIDIGKWIEQTADGGFIVAATIESDSSGHISEPSYGGRDYWIFKIDSAGTLLWEKRFGGPGTDIAQNFIIMPDSSIYLFGQGTTGISAVKTDPGKGGEDYWLVHFKYDESGTGINDVESAYVSVYPNPSSGSIHIPETFFGYALYVFDLTGRITHQTHDLQSTNMDIGFLPQGFYLLKFKKGERVYYAKLILQ